jgi:hypothetical protein
LGRAFGFQAGKLGRFGHKINGHGAAFGCGDIIQTHLRHAPDRTIDKAVTLAMQRSCGVPQPISNSGKRQLNLRITPSALVS